MFLAPLEELVECLLRIKPRTAQEVGSGDLNSLHSLIIGDRDGTYGWILCCGRGRNIRMNFFCRCRGGFWLDIGFRRRITVTASSVLPNYELGDDELLAFG